MKEVLTAFAVDSDSLLAGGSSTRYYCQVAASDEHVAISQAFIDVVEQLSNSQLYGFRESNRSLFDFACNLNQTHSRIIVGQTLWGHHEGILKDVVSLQAELDLATFGVYLFPDTMRVRRAVDEAIQQVRRIRQDATLPLRMIPIPPDFRADTEDHLDQLRGHLRQKISEDIILRLVLGNVNPDDIARFQHFANMPGVNLALLDAIHQGIALTPSELSKTLQVPNTTLTGKLNTLIAGGFVRLNGVQREGLPAKGALVRDLASLLYLGVVLERGVTRELQLMLPLFGLSIPSNVPDLSDMRSLTVHYNGSDPESRCVQLLAEASRAVSMFGMNMEVPSYGSHAVEGQ